MPALLTSLLFLVFVVGSGQAAYNKIIQAVHQKSPTGQTKLVVPHPPPPTTANRRHLTAATVRLDFDYPSDSRYIEVDFSREFDKKQQNVGHLATFTDRRDNSPSFVAVSRDFAMPDFPFQDNLEGTLDSPTSFNLKNYDKATAFIKELEPGLFYYVGYQPSQCAPIVSAYLFARPPAGSNLRYLSFHLGDAQLPVSDAKSIPCDQPSGEVKRRIADLADNRVAAVKKQLDRALIISRTLAAK